MVENHPAEANLHKQRVNTSLRWYNSLMRAIVPRDVGSHSYAGTGYANPHAATKIDASIYAFDMKAGGWPTLCHDLRKRSGRGGGGRKKSPKASHTP